MRILAVVTLVCVCALASAQDWVEPMKAVHAKFSGEKGVFAQFGDSITDSRAFWFSLKWTRGNASPEMLAAFERVSGHMLDDCWDRKGAEFGNQGSMTIRWCHENIDTWLENLNPEAAIVMFGTNDLNSVPQPEYEEKLREVLGKCLDNGTVPILSTIPPRHGFEAQASQYAEVIRKIAGELSIPLTDFHAEVMRRRPEDWNGKLEKFADYEGYNVPTLIARDGVHPSNPEAFSGDYSEEALNSNGFSLRNYMVLMAYSELIEKVLQAQ